MTLDEIITEVEKRIPHPQRSYLRLVPKVSEEQLPVHVILVEDEQSGCVQYMRMSADGHLGALDA